ncbi:F0F1 ATP synthase subunit B [Candidatus Daviesbacteria bacterium]|nr:F0F1 ATP synthase subunit B [Candidatus Daviesbacteria bacterium]
MDILSQFGVQPVLLAAQVVNFLILLFILKRFLYKPVLKVLDERRKRVEESLKNAEEIEKKLLETEEAKNKILEKASLDVQKMLDETKKEIEVMKEEGKVQSEQMAAQIIKKGQEEARAAVEKMEQELMSKLGDIVALGMEKVTGKVLKTSDQKEIIEKTVRGMS